MNKLLQINIDSRLPIETIIKLGIEQICINVKNHKNADNKLDCTLSINEILTLIRKALQ